MQNRVTVNVAGRAYVLLAEEGEEYVRQVAAYVHEKMQETMSSGGDLGREDCAVLAALNIADQRFKDRQAGENLRQQIKDLLEENAQLKMQLHQVKNRK